MAPLFGHSARRRWWSAAFLHTAWLWANTFGSGVLSLRLYSSAAMCAALLVTWKTIRRYYGMWATAFGSLLIWGTSGTLLDQNAEGRYYGLYMLAVALAVEMYASLAARVEAPRPVACSCFLLAGCVGVDPRDGFAVQRLAAAGFDRHGWGAGTVQVEGLSRLGGWLADFAGVGAGYFAHRWQWGSRTDGFVCRGWARCSIRTSSIPGWNGLPG